MKPEAPGQKAVRLLREGRVVVLRASQHGARAEVHGTSGIYRAALWAHGDVSCSCDFAGDGVCSHLRAVALLVRGEVRLASGLPWEPGALLK